MGVINPLLPKDMLYVQDLLLEKRRLADEVRGPAKGEPRAQAGQRGQWSGEAGMSRAAGRKSVSSIPVFNAAELVLAASRQCSITRAPPWK